MKTFFFAVILIFLFSLPIATGELPANINDGNHFWQEITVESDADVGNALFHFWLPFPMNYSKEFESYRFYDDAGNPVPFHVFNVTANASSISIRADLSAGTNTFYFTGGNPDLDAVWTTSVYDFYNFTENLTADVTIDTGEYNYIQLSTNKSGLVYMTSQMNFTLWNSSNTSDYQRYNIINQRDGAWVLRYYWNNASYYQTPRYPGNPDNSTPIATFLAVDNIDSAAGTNMDVIGRRLGNYQYNLSVVNYTAINETASIDGFNQINITRGYTTSYVQNLTIASGVYSPVTVVFSNVSFTDSVSGLYVEVVEGGDGVNLNLSVNNKNMTPLGGTLLTNPQNLHFRQLAYSQAVNSSSVTLNPETNNLTFTFADGIYDMNMTSVIYIPEADLKRDTPIELKLNLGSNFSKAINANIYNLTLAETVNYIKLPAVTTVTASRTSIYGVVTDSRGNPVEDVRVTYYFSSNGTLVNTSNSATGGMFGYSNLSVATMYYMTFEKNGYVSNSTYATTGNVNTSVFAGNIVMVKLYNITISVVDESGSPVNSFTTFLGPNQTIQSTDNGTVTYKNITEGETEVIIQAPGFAQVTRMIQVDENSTDFVLTVTKEPAAEYVTPHYVRLFYRTITGSPVSGLNIDVFDASGDTVLFQGVTGTDGSVSFQLNETIKYRFVAMSGDTLVNEFTTFPKSNEYVIFVSGQIVEPPSDVLSETMYSIKEDGTSSGLLRMRAAAETTGINVSMWSNSSSVVNYNIIVYQENNVFETRSGNFTELHTEVFTVPLGYVYTISITFTDSDGKTRTVSKTLRLDGSSNADKAKFAIPGFTEEWHYSALCALIVLVTAFSFSVKTRRVGGLIIPGEMLIMGYVGWINVTAFAICLSIAVVIMSLIYFVEKAGSEESLS